MAGTPLLPLSAEPDCRRLLSEASDWLEWVATVVLAVVAVRTLLVALRRYRGTSGSVRTTRNAESGARLLQPGGAHGPQPRHVDHFRSGRGRSIRESEGDAAWPAVALFAVGALLASAAWQLLLTGSGNLLGRVLSGRRGQLGISVCSALLMLGLAVGATAELSPISPSSFSVAASRTQVARPSMAAATSSGEGKVGAILMFRSRGSRP